MSPPLIYWSPVTVIWFIRWIRRLCIQITVLSLSLVILLGFTWDFKMEETTHDSSSSSRKSEEKCPPAGGIKMKIGGFKTGHCYHKPSDAAIQHEPSGVSSGVWLPRLSQDDFDRVVQTTHSGLLAVSDVYSCAHVAHSRNIPINPSASSTLQKMHYIYKLTCEYSCSKALMSHNMNLLSSHFTISRALHSCDTVNRKVNCGLTPNKNGNCAEFFLI